MSMATDNLLALNRKFMKGAKEVWFIDPRNRWFDYDRIECFDWYYYTPLMTIRKQNSILFVLDIDYDMDIVKGREIAQRISDTFPGSFSQPKFSGSAGVQIMNEIVETPQLREELKHYDKIYQYMNALQIPLLEKSHLKVAERTNDIKEHIDDPDLVCVKPATQKKFVTEAVPLVQEM